MFKKLHDPGPTSLTIFIDGLPVTAEEHETVAAVVLRQDESWIRKTPAGLAKRAPYCMMGVCFDCLAEVDGVGSIQTCMTAVCENMRVKRQIGRREVQE